MSEYLKNLLSLSKQNPNQSLMDSSNPILDEQERQKALTTNIPDFSEQDNRINQEMSNAQEIENESMDLAGQMEPEIPVEEPSKKDQYQQMLNQFSKLKPQEQAVVQDDLKALQQQALDKSKTLNWFRLGDKLAQAYGERHGGKVTGMQDIYDTLEKQAQQPVLDYKQLQQNQLDLLKVGNEEQMNDPMSDISQFAQKQAVAMAKRMGISEEAVNKLQGMTARQLENLGFKSIGASLSARTAQQSDYETNDGQPLSFDPITNKYVNILSGQAYTGPVRRKVINQFIDPNTGNVMLRDRTNIMSVGAKKPVEEKPEEKITRRDLTPKQKDLLDETRKSLESDPKYKNSMEAVDGADNAMALLQAGKDSGQDLVRAIQTMLAKSSGQVGVLTEQDVAGFNGRADVISRLERFATTAVKGKLPEEDRKFLMDFAKTMQAAARRNLQESAEVKRQQLTDDLGVKPEQAADLLNIPQRVLMPEGPKGASGLTPEQRQKRIQELKAKQGMK